MKTTRITTRAQFTGEGSQTRSALCHIEQGYRSFKINGVEYLWFNQTTDVGHLVSYKWYDIEAIITPEKTLKRVKILTGPHDQNKYL